MNRTVSLLQLSVDGQESDGQKTNNGIHYRLQLLYANGKRASRVSDNDVWVGGRAMSRGQRLTTAPFHPACLDDTTSRTIERSLSHSNETVARSCTSVYDMSHGCYFYLEIKV